MSGARVIAVDVEDRELAASPFRIIIEDSVIPCSMYGFTRFYAPQPENIRMLNPS